MKTQLLSLLALSATGICTSATGDTLYSNLGPGDSFQTSAFWSPSVTPGRATYKFTAMATGYVTSIDAAVAPVQPPSGGTSYFDLLLYGDSGSGTLGSLLMIQPFYTTAVASTPSLGSWIVDANMPPSVLLTAGQNYYLGFSHPASEWRWFNNDQGVTTFLRYDGDIAQYMTPGWTTGAFRINGNLVVPAPEPGTLVLIGLGLAGLGVSRRRKAN